MGVTTGQGRRPDLERLPSVDARAGPQARLGRRAAGVTAAMPAPVGRPLGSVTVCTCTPRAARWELVTRPVLMICPAMSVTMVPAGAAVATN